MKPSWDDAPEWANWLAMDFDGRWFWHQCEPKWHKYRAEWMSDEKFESAAIFRPEDSLEQRP